MEVTGIKKLAPFDTERLSDRQWYEQLQARLRDASMPAPRPQETAAATYSPQNMAAASSYLLYTQSGTLALMLSQQGLTTTSGKPSQKDPESIKAVDSTLGARVDKRF